MADKRMNAIFGICGSQTPCHACCCLHIAESGAIPRIVGSLSSVLLYTCGSILSNCRHCECKKGEGVP
jgi:hypothetical protein